MPNTNLLLYFEFIKDHPYLGKPTLKDCIKLNVVLREIMINHLSIIDIMNLSRTCKFLHSICVSDSIWKFIYEKYFIMYDTITEVRKRDYFKICQMVYGKYFHVLKLQLLVKFGYPLHFMWWSDRPNDIRLGAVPKKKNCENSKVCYNAKRNESMNNLYEDDDDDGGTSVEDMEGDAHNSSGIFLHDDSDDDTETVINVQTLDTNTNSNDHHQQHETKDDGGKKLTTSISQIKIRDKSTNGNEFDYYYYHQQHSCCSDGSSGDGGDENYHDTQVSKTQVKCRLALLIKHAMKYPIDYDDCLPGDKTKKYALKYV